MPPPLSLLEGLKSAKLTTWDNDNGCLSPDTPSSSGTDPDYGTTQTSDVTSDDERCRRTAYSPLRAAAGGAMPAAKAKAKAAANHAASTTRQGQEAGPAYEGTCECFGVLFPGVASRVDTSLACADCLQLVSTLPLNIIH